MLLPITRNIIIIIICFWQNDLFLINTKIIFSIDYWRSNTRVFNFISWNDVRIIEGSDNRDSTVYIVFSAYYYGYSITRNLCSKTLKRATQILIYSHTFT